MHLFTTSHRHFSSTQNHQTQSICFLSVSNEWWDYFSHPFARNTHQHNWIGIQTASRTVQCSLSFFFSLFCIVQIKVERRSSRRFRFVIAKNKEKYSIFDKRDSFRFIFVNCVCENEVSSYKLLLNGILKWNSWTKIKLWKC